LRLFLACGLVAAVTGVPKEGRTAEPAVLKIDSDGVQRATMTLDSYSYEPNHLVVQAGKPVELLLSSVTMLTPHNFVLKEPAAGLMVDQDVGAGKSATVRFTPTHPGTFVFYCDKKLLFFKSHREKGMEGRLEVRE
jgi:plastocyanin